MSEYFDNHDFNALMAPVEEDLDLNFDEYLALIRQNEAAGYDYNATYGFDPAVDFGADAVLDFDLNAGFQHDPSLPVLPDATAMTGQSPLHNVVCEFCHVAFETRAELQTYTHRHDNDTIKTCGLLGCNSRFYNCEDIRSHRDTPHSPSHRAVWDDLTITCAECNRIFENKTQLHKHSKDQKHNRYACSCGVNFARNGVLTRHLESFTKESAKYPCTLCRRHQGNQSFRRKDHLIQHFQGYHKMDQDDINNASPPKSQVQSRQILICPHADCEAYRDDAFKTLGWREQFDGKPFQTQSDYNKHMRDIHKESTFSCPVGSCDRVGAKGYMREKDLIKHLAAKHPEAPSYSYVPPKPPKYRCAKCSLELSSLGSLQWHEQIQHPTGIIAE
ncbi:hypothetical protein F5Y12DRAFT_711041 [Xylaria sp. FL1777]|nr:hypothetical protein F5Y12DRAFT_711041 [Xylaria sp. FL1777]